MSEEPLIDAQGQVVMNEQTGEPVMTKRVIEDKNKQRNPESGGQQNPEIGSSVLGPMHMTVPLASTSFDSAPWAMEISMQPSHLLRELYPDKADYIPEKGRIVTSDLYQHRILSLLTSGLHGVIRSLDPYTLEGFMICYHYEMAPDVDFPNGLMMIVADDIPLVIDELPLTSRYSWEHCGYYKVPARFWYRGMVEDLIHPQDQVNKLEQYLQLNDDHNSQPTWLVPSSSGIPEGGVSNAPGLVLRYHPPYKPEVQQGVQLSPQFLERRRLYQEDIEEVSGVRNVLMGNAPRGVRAGVALNRLGEEAEGLFAPIVKRFDRFLERDAQSQLQLVQKYWTLPRYFSIQDPDAGIVEIKDFKGTMLLGNLRVKIESGSYRPRSLSDRREVAMGMFQAGLLAREVGKRDASARVGVAARQAQFGRRRLDPSVGPHRGAQDPGVVATADDGSDEDAGPRDRAHQSDHGGRGLPGHFDIRAAPRPGGRRRERRSAAGTERPAAEEAKRGHFRRAEAGAGGSRCVCLEHSYERWCRARKCRRAWKGHRTQRHPMMVLRRPTGLPRPIHLPTTGLPWRQHRPNNRRLRGHPSWRGYGPRTSS
jgi:hypothetical protein